MTPEELEREARMQAYHDEPWVDQATRPRPLTEDDAAAEVLAEIINEYVRAQRAEHRLYPEHWSTNLAQHLMEAGL